ncbi:MAG: HepT-like ribonuclease domain-containing protein [Pirellulales bacterium]
MSDERTALADIVDECDLVSEFINDRSESDFHTDLLLQSAVLYRLLVLGEAVTRVSDETRLLHSTVDWRGFAGLRNVLIHQYHKVDLARVWKIVGDELSQLRRQVSDILAGGKQP